MLRNPRNISKINKSFVVLCLLYLSFGITNSALAEYKKPKAKGENDAPSSQSTGIAATRSGSCNPVDNKTKANSAGLTTLAPSDHIGQSAATNPIFAWYIPDRESYPVAFSLYEADPKKYSGKGKQIYQTRLTSSAGIMTHELPREVSLDPGKTYLWQTAVICNPNSPSQTLVVTNQVQIVDIDPATKSQLNGAKDSVIAATIYAQSGLWYDALAQVTRLQNPQAEDATVKLLNQLATTEQNSNNLEQVINSLQQRN